ncbi:MAG: hypothetical protein ACOC02_00075 [Guyparkeria sp.]
MRYYQTLQEGPQESGPMRSGAMNRHDLALLGAQGYRVPPAPGDEAP